MEILCWEAHILNKRTCWERCVPIIVEISKILSLVVNGHEVRDICHYPGLRNMVISHQLCLNKSLPNAMWNMFGNFISQIIRQLMRAPIRSKLVLVLYSGRDLVFEGQLRKQQLAVAACWQCILPGAAMQHALAAPSGNQGHPGWPPPTPTTPKRTNARKD